MTTATSTDTGGVLVLDKPGGMTSHDVVARLRRVLGIRRVGHAGTLDPMATGVLVVGFGRGTRLLPYLQATEKCYDATIRLGWATATDDRTGEPLGPPAATDLDGPAIDALMARFVGPILQRPSAVSAIKVDGRRAYARARGGESVELVPRPVVVHEFHRCGPPRPTADAGLEVAVRVRCSSGTYVRALARDLGAAAGCGAHLVALRRTAVGPFLLGQAQPLPDRGDPPPPAMSLGQAAAAVLPVVHLEAPDAAAAALGQRVGVGAAAPDGPCALLTPTAGLVAVARADAGQWRYLAVFGEQ